MTKPEGIHQDVWDAASEAWEAMTHTVICRDAETEVIARAILAEREACARIADERTDSDYNWSEFIADEIRKRGENHEQARDLRRSSARNP
jgi:hypothetical protein